MTRYSFPRDVELSGLVAKALFMGVQKDATQRAELLATSCYIVRTFHGFRVADRAPPFGEHWKADPSGIVTHVEGPII